MDREFLSPEETETIPDEYDQLCERYGLQEDKRAAELRKFVECGIAYHHAGMLPTLKEVVERLFTLGYINECIARMNRDVVDAERQLRAG